MSDFNSIFHHRKSMRSNGYDYSADGFYFITISVQNRDCLLGKIDSNKMILNDAGQMVVKWYTELKNKFPEIHCHEMVVMPNHFHCIIQIDGIGGDIVTDAHAGAPLRGRPIDNLNFVDQPHYGPDNKKFHPTVCDIVDWFKTMTTNEYIRGVKNLGWKRFDGHLWQRNYWDDIIRSDDSLDRIAEYTLHNPERWEEDQLNPESGNVETLDK